MIANAKVIFLALALVSSWGRGVCPSDCSRVTTVVGASHFLRECLPGGTRLSPQPARASESQLMRFLLEWLHWARLRPYLLMKLS